MVEVDEMHSYIGSKKNSCWIWIAVDRYGKRFLNFVIGDRSNKTAKKFWKTINHHEMKYIASDYWKPYESIIPKESKIDGAQQSPLFTTDGSEPTERIGHDCRSQKQKHLLLRDITLIQTLLGKNEKKV
jgi:IS1 family transposase